MPIRSILALALSAALLTGCGGETAPEASEPTESATPAEPEHEPEPEPEPEPTPDVGTSFVDFVRGGPVPPMERQVALYLGNALTGVVTPGLAADLPAWATCTEVGEYAGRSCPISPVRVLKQHRKLDYTEAVESDCLQTYGPIPKPLRTLDRVVVVPAKRSVGGCADDFAVQLFANDEGQLVAVSTLLGAG
ncbi:hypothetical protein [Nocardioides sp. SR21]|uniref:hypothetical protein n=1 Tax=Nocardioides sp. SR21 TaxID=2919501 RepID=UPI001FAB1ED6|nr:hypothetical protein [Nocardioides sp. SR21]